MDRGDWFFPSGVSLQSGHISNGVTYRDQRIDLYRGSTMPSGMYRCDVGTRSVTDPRVPAYVGLYYSSGGKATYITLDTSIYCNCKECDIKVPSQWVSCFGLFP